MALDVATTGNSGRMDDLLDLNFSASNQKPIQPQSQGKSSFDYLAGPAPVQARSSQPGAAHLSAQTSPLPLQPSLKPASNQKSSQNDAFSSLFGVSPAKDPKSLSMAERLQSVTP